MGLLHVCRHGRWLVGLVRRRLPQPSRGTPSRQRRRTRTHPRGCGRKPDRRRRRAVEGDLTRADMWAIAAAYFCFFYGAYFYLTWFPTYLIEYRHLPLKDVGVLASVPLIAAMIGDLAGGLLTDALLRKTGRLTWSR